LPTKKKAAIQACKFFLNSKMLLLAVNEQAHVTTDLSDGLQDSKMDLLIVIFHKINFV
jgi:hypothetical protein